MGVTSSPATRLIRTSGQDELANYVKEPLRDSDKNRMAGPGETLEAHQMCRQSCRYILGITDWCDYVVLGTQDQRRTFHSMKVGQKVEPTDLPPEKVRPQFHISHLSRHHVWVDGFAMAEPPAHQLEVCDRLLARLSYLRPTGLPGLRISAALACPRRPAP